MRIGALAAFVAMAASTVAPALAQASFQRISQDGGPVYWDAASIKRSGDAFEVEVLQPYKTGPNASAPVHGSLTWHKLSCVWSASVGGTLGRRTIDATGKTLESSGPEPFSQGAFYGPHGWKAVVTPLVCDRDNRIPKGMSVGQAIADAKAAFAAKAPAPADPPRADAAPADGAPARFGLIREEKTIGNMSFLDWSRITRAGDKVTVQTLDVLGDDTPPPPAPQWSYSVIALRTLLLDCKARTLTQTGFHSFTKFLEPGFPDGLTWPVRTADDWPLGAQILDAACWGKEPARTFASRAAALAHQRSVHPLKTADR
jgi:hypothetical protein